MGPKVFNQEFCCAVFFLGIISFGAKLGHFFLHRLQLNSKALVLLGWIHGCPFRSQSSRALALAVEPIVKGGFGNIKFKGYLGYGFTLDSDKLYRFLLELGRVATGHILSLLEV